MVKTLLAALALLSALPAAAQVRVGPSPSSGVRAPVFRRVEAAAVADRGPIAPTLFSIALSPAPSLSAPSAPSASPSRSPAAATPTPQDIQAEAARVVSEWKASRAAKTAEQVRPTPAADAPPSDLDALFDGSLPTSRALLARAEALGLPRAALALALSEARSTSDAAARLSSLGVLGSLETSLAASEVIGFRYLLTRLWRKTSPAVPDAFPVDATFAIPALKVERDGATYFVHGVAHGQSGPPRRGAMLRLVREIGKAGHALYSEQNFPVYYGYKDGRETLDHASEQGAPAAVVFAAPGMAAATLRVMRASRWLFPYGPGLAALAAVVLHPNAAIFWIALGVLALLAWEVSTGSIPLMRWRRRRLAARIRAEGLEDMADQFEDEARDFFVAEPDLAVLRGLELPQPLGATADPFSARSRAIADAVAADAAASGASAVHVVVGHMHAHEVAWRLANGPRAAAPGSQTA